jgi:hypothetical protein
MGASVSTYLLGFHMLLECGAGFTIFQSGAAPASADPDEALKTTGRDKLWKRWHASGLLAMAYVGYLGVTQPESLKMPAIQTCGIFHSFALISSILAYQDSTINLNQALWQNVHLYVAIGFASVAVGILE